MSTNHAIDVSYEATVSTVQITVDLTESISVAEADRLQRDMKAAVAAALVGDEPKNAPAAEPVNVHEVVLRGKVWDALRTNTATEKKAKAFARLCKPTMTPRGRGTQARFTMSEVDLRMMLNLLETLKASGTINQWVRESLRNDILRVEKLCP